jgi:AraC-like DNA-binding protein
MRIANLSGFQDLVRHLGADPRALLERHDIDPLSMQRPGSLRRLQVGGRCLRVLQHIAQSSVVRSAARAGSRTRTYYGCVTALCRAASSVRESVAGFIELPPGGPLPGRASCSSSRAARPPRSGGTCARISGSNNQANYQAAMLNLKLLRLIGGKAFRPSYVNLAVDAQPSAIVFEIENKLGCRFHKTTADNAIAFPVHVARSTRRQVPADCCSNCSAGTWTGSRRQSRTSHRGPRCRIMSAAPCPRATARSSAAPRKLGMSVRTLAGEPRATSGLKFCDILERQRIDACPHVPGPGRNCHWTTSRPMLGYSEQSSFGRAFKRWTGTTPLLYRQGMAASRGLSAQEH